MPTTDRQVFHLALAELIRRQAEPPIPQPEDLTAFELGVYSQNGEDGVLAEIFRRLGPGRREFVEFGVGRGVEGNSVALADVFGWSGLFMEGDDTAARSLAWKYRDNDRVRTARAMVTAENVEELFAANGVSPEPDLMSIDVDGNDLWIWKAMTRTRARVVVIEYNAHLDQSRPLVIPYDAEWVWGGTDWFGASLAALELVGAERGYRLVHTELAGANAFFVRDDYADRFDDIRSVPRRSQNYDGHGYGLPEHPGGGRYVELAG